MSQPEPGRLEQTGLRLGALADAAGGDVEGVWLDRLMQRAAEQGLPRRLHSRAPVRRRLRPRRHPAPARLSEGRARQLPEAGLADRVRPHRLLPGHPRYPGEQEQAAFVESSTQMLESLDFVERYVWFTQSTQTGPTGCHDGATANTSGRAYRDAD